MMLSTLPFIVKYLLPVTLAISFVVKLDIFKYLEFITNWSLELVVTELFSKHLKGLFLVGFFKFLTAYEILFQSFHRFQNNRMEYLEVVLLDFQILYSHNSQSNFTKYGNIF